MDHEIQQQSNLEPQAHEQYSSGPIQELESRAAASSPATSSLPAVDTRDVSATPQREVSAASSNNQRIRTPNLLVRARRMKKKKLHKAR
jgi:hypothetical protein